MVQRSITFRLRPEVAREHIARVVEMGVRKIGMQILRGVVLRTPVDTGRARSNWFVSIGAPVTAEREPYAPGEQLGLDEGANGGMAISIGAATIDSAPAYGVIYLSNNLPYILALEYGHSQRQAPAGMVRVTLDQVAAQFAA